MTRMIIGLTLLTAIVLAVNPLGAKPGNDEPVFLGVMLEPIDNVTPGMQVVRVIKDSPAEKAGLKAGMILIKVDTVTILAGPKARGSLDRALAGATAGAGIEVLARDRDGRTATLNLVPIGRKAWARLATKNLADSIVEQVSELRELDVKKDVAINIYTRSGLGRELREDFERETIVADMKKQDLLLVRLGALPDGVDSVAVMLKMLQLGVQGFYSPDDKELVLIAGQSGPESESVMAHELTHAIQDQHFNLRDFMVTALYNSDRSSAARFVVEGDAKVLELQYRLKHQKIDERKIWLKPQPVGGRYIPPKLDPETRFINMNYKQMMGPYTTGARFVAEAHRRGGWDAVNRLYLDLPESTEQIIHWDKYFGERDVPTEIDMNDFVDWADDDTYEVNLYDVMGELSIIRLFLNFVNRKTVNAEEVGAGWDGDRIVGLRNRKSGLPAVVWLSIWDSEKDAEEFAGAMKTLYASRFGRAPGDDPAVAAVDGKGNVTRIVRQGTRVSLVDGVPAKEAVELEEKARSTAILRETTRRKFSK